MDSDSRYSTPDGSQLAALNVAIESQDHFSIAERDLRLFGPQLARLQSPTFDRCDLRGICLEGTRQKPIAWSQAKVHHCLVAGFKINWATLEKANIQTIAGDAEAGTVTFRNCNLTGAELVFHTAPLLFRFLNCNLNRCALYSSGLTPRLEFVCAKGLWGNEGARIDGLGGEIQTSAQFHTKTDFPTWERLRRIGATRLMSISWIAVLGLIIYSNALRWYNGQIKALKVHVPEQGAADSWVDRLGPLPSPSVFGWLMIAIVLIAFAATILHWWCPPLVLHQTRHEWSVLSSKPDLAYQGASYDRWKARWICAMCYATGGLIAGVYLLWRFINSVVFFFGWFSD